MDFVKNKARRYLFATLYPNATRITTVDVSLVANTLQKAVVKVNGVQLYYASAGTSGVEKSTADTTVKATYISRGATSGVTVIINTGVWVGMGLAGGVAEACQMVPST